MIMRAAKSMKIGDERATKVAASSSAARGWGALSAARGWGALSAARGWGAMVCGAFAWGVCVVGVATFSTARPALAEVSLFSTPDLINAVSTGDLAAVKALLVRGGAPNMTDVKGQTALILAVTAGNEAMARLLLENGALVNLSDRMGNTALHWAVERGDSACFSLLIGAKGLKADAENRQGATPLMMAARSGNYEFVDRLLKAGARVDKTDYTGRTAEDWAKEGRSSRIQERLRRGAGRM